MEDFTAGVPPAVFPSLPLKGSNPDLETFFAVRLSMLHTPDRTDVLKFNCLLFDVLADVPVISERHNRDIIPYFFTFMDDVYDKIHEGSARVQDLTVGVCDQSETMASVTGEGEDDIDSDDDDDDEEEDDLEENLSVGQLNVEDDKVMDVAGDEGEVKTKNASSKKFSNRQQMKKKFGAAAAMKKSARLRLRDFLKLFAVFKNPQAAFQSPRLETTFSELLLRTDDEIQTLALKCVLAYKHVFLTPYSGALLALAEDGADFQDQLFKFRLDESAGVVDNAHRLGLINTLSRILISKMLRRKGKGSQGRHGPKARRGIILRFITSCRAEELEAFTCILFNPFPDSETISNAGMVSSQVIPLKKQLGFLNLIHDLLSTLGSSLQLYLSRVFKIALQIICHANHLLVSRSQIRATHIPMLKNLRLTGIKRIVELFRSFPESNFAPLQEVIYDAMVKPQLPALIHESIQRPSALLELFNVWSSDSRLRYLLTGVGDTIIPVTFSLLSVRNVAHSVIESVLTIADHLLVADNGGAMAEGERMDVVSDSDAPCSFTAALTASIIQPHIPCLLQHLPSLLLSAAAAMSTEKQKKDGKVFTLLQLSILSRISSYATDAVIASSLTALLLPFLGRQRRDVPEPARLHILSVVLQLTRLFSVGRVHYSFLCQLFSSFSSSATRSALCEIFYVMGEQDASIRAVMSVLSGLNAMDTSRIEDEFDYEKRQAACQIVFDSCGSWNVNQLLPITHNFIYFSALDDSAVRSLASSGLATVITRVAVGLNEAGTAALSPDGSSAANGAVAVDMFNNIILRILYPAIKRQMKSHQEAVRVVFLGTLEQLVVAFPAHPAFTEMTALREVDQEKDFFRNIVHIQMHRRIRAVVRLGVLVKEGVITQPTLVHVMVPIVSHFFFENSKESDHNLVTAAVECLGLCYEDTRVRGYEGTRVRGCEDRYEGTRVRGWVRGWCEDRYEGARVRGYEGTRVRG